METQATHFNGNRYDVASKPYLIAEVGVNHEGSMELAKLMIQQAHDGGASAVKFQTYKAETLAAKNSPAYWDTSKEATTSQFKLFKRFDSFGESEFQALSAHCNAIGIDFLSTPFDAAAIDFLAPLMPMYKIASADLTNTPMLRHVASKGKPVLLSTGASTISEIRHAVETLNQNGAREVTILHCVLSYPCSYANAHLGMIEGLAAQFPDHVIGYSDHTVPDDAMAVLTAAWLKGAVVIEKHFTHDKSLPGNDHYHAMDVEDLRRFMRNVDLLAAAHGSSEKAPLESEEISRQNARRSIITIRSVQAGEAVGEDMIACKRPGTGISPLDWDQVLGKTVRRDLEDDHILQWDDLA